MFSLAAAAPPTATTRARFDMPSNTQNFLSASGNANLLPPGVPLPPGAQFAPTEQTDWSIIESSNANATQTDNALYGMTCVSASDCWAVGSFYNGNNFQSLIERWNGTSWTIVPSPNADPGMNNSLKSVTCVSASDCWAVGSYSSGTMSKTLIERWDGVSWVVVPSPNASAAQQDLLASVTCASASDCWAVGSYFSGGAVDRSQTLIERWNGTSWNIVTSLNTSPAQNNYLTNVTCASASDCWAVGYYASELAYQTLVERWDGISWTIVPSPNAVGIPIGPFDPPVKHNYLNAVTCLSASNCWSVGSAWSSFAEQSLIQHWDGIAWTIVTSPNTSTSQRNVLSSVSCASTSDCLAVGFFVNGTISQTIVERWDGTSWTIAPSLNSSPSQNNYLAAVTCESGSNCWAVGHYRTTGIPADQTLIERWDGNTWTILPSPNVSSATTDNILLDLTCSSATDCWAVGYYANGGINQTLIERWDGTAWTTISSPNVGAARNFLFGVACASADDCWAVGYYWNGSANKALIERWNGSSWTIATAPDPGASSLLYDVTCVSASDCWAVGTYNGRELIERWDGTSWTVVTAPVSNQGVLNDVTCASPSNCWAVGSYRSGSIDQTLIERWNGTSWSVVLSPNSGTQGNVLTGAACASASDCWAVGRYYNGSIWQPVIERWNGSSWTIASSPDTGGGSGGLNVLQSVACVSASNCWAVGSYFPGTESTAQTLIERWDGNSWAIVASPNTGATQPNSLFGVTCVPAADCWAAGYGGLGRLQTLTVRYSPPVPIPTSVVSRKTHGAAGIFDIELPATGNVGIECRSGGGAGAHQLVASFATPVTYTSAAVTSGTATVATTSGSGTNAITIDLTAVANAQTVSVTLFGVTDGSVTGDIPIRMGVLLGDTGASGNVNSSDIGQTKANSGQTTDGHKLPHRRHGQRYHQQQRYRHGEGAIRYGFAIESASRRLIVDDAPGAVIALVAATPASILGG